MTAIISTIRYYIYRSTVVQSMDATDTIQIQAESISKSESKFCQSCGKALNFNEKFCSNCGAPIE
ncbi:MAG: zinc ribbon domain-containing protein [Candidatus Heimdallarchaeota archaeon]